LGESKIAVYKHIGGKIFPAMYATSPNAWGSESIPLNHAFQGLTAQREQPTEILESPIQKMILDLAANY
jgi:hypothetical protein